MRSLGTVAHHPGGRLRERAGRILRRRHAVETTGFTPLIDAKAASELLGVPPTWLLAQARAGRIPHHRLGHYVRFDPNDLSGWLAENRIVPGSDGRRP
jgi:excisionase family DNA binding protein